VFRRAAYIILFTVALLSYQSADARNRFIASLQERLAAQQDSVVVPPPIDSVELARIADSVALAKMYDSIDRVWWSEVDTTTLPDLDTMYKAYLDSIVQILPDTLDIKRAKKAVAKERRDSIKQNKPRVLATSALPDSLYYQRIVSWTADTRFNELTLKELDTLANEHFYDYPFFKKDVNATYLGTIGSPTQNYNWFKREELEEAPTYTPYLNDTYTPENLPQYNTKTPYTILAYWGTPFSYKKKEEGELKLLSTQNITPEFNFTLGYLRYGSMGMLQNEETNNRTSFVAFNYLGKRYVANGGYIGQTVIHNENGGVQDTFWVRDTVVDTKSISVNLSDASSLYVFLTNASYLDGKYAGFAKITSGINTFAEICEDVAANAKIKDDGTIAKKKKQPIIKKIVLED